MDPRGALRLPEDDKEEKRMTLSSLSLSGLFFSLSLPGLARQSKDIRNLLTICTQKASRSNKGSRRSRSCGQAGNSLSLPGLFFFLSLPGLARQSNYDP